MVKTDVIVFFLSICPLTRRVVGAPSGWSRNQLPPSQSVFHSSVQFKMVSMRSGRPSGVCLECRPRQCVFDEWSVAAGPGGKQFWANSLRIYRNSAATLFLDRDTLTLIDARTLGRQTNITGSCVYPKYLFLNSLSSCTPWDKAPLAPSDQRQEDTVVKRPAVHCSACHTRFLPVTFMWAWCLQRR